MGNLMVKEAVGPDFIIYLDVDWESQYVKNRQHFIVTELARQLKEHSKILAVERPICPITTIVQRDSKRFISLLKRQAALRQEAENLFIYTPIVIMHDRIASYFPGFGWANQKLLSTTLKRVLQHLNFDEERLIAWIHHPYQAVNIGLVNERILIYDCYDSYDTFWWMNDRRRREIIDLEERILNKVDLVFTASIGLREEKKRSTGRVYYVPNGSDVDHFTQAGEQSTPIPAEMSLIPHPIIGFAGRLGRRIDFSLLAYVAKSHRSWSIVMIGPSPAGTCNRLGEQLEEFDDYNELRALPNVHLLGQKPYSLLPQYIKAFDVCVIPYIKNEHNIASCPLKLYEYLATGKPIISVSLPEVDKYKDIVKVAKRREEFLAHCEEAIYENDIQAREKRVEVARQSSWGKRVEQVLLAVKEVFETPKVRNP